MASVEELCLRICSLGNPAPKLKSFEAEVSILSHTITILKIGSPVLLGKDLQSLVVAKNFSFVDLSGTINMSF